MKQLFYCSVYLFIFCLSSFGQQSLQWVNVDHLFSPLPLSVQVYQTTTALEGKPNKAFYVIADLKDPSLRFTADTTHERRLTPSAFYEKNGQPIVVVNTTFFSFATNQNLNVVIKDSKVVGYNPDRSLVKSGDTVKKVKVYNSAIGISKSRKADVAWTRTDSSLRYVYATQGPIYKGNFFIRKEGRSIPLDTDHYKKWKMQTAVGGGPVLIQNGAIKITNEEEWKFAGKAINDKHPRTAMGYTADRKLIILVVQGRTPGSAEGATLVQAAQILKELGCVEALNLDGGGSSCLLINGKETIKPSDKEGQRPVPAVFIIQKIH